MQKRKTNRRSAQLTGFTHTEWASTTHVAIDARLANTRMWPTPDSHLITNTGLGTDTVTVNGAATFQDDITISTPDTTINAALTSTGNGTIGIGTDNIDITAAVNAGTGRVEIAPQTAGNNIHFGNTTSAGSRGVPAAG